MERELIPDRTLRSRKFLALPTAILGHPSALLLKGWALD